MILYDFELIIVMSIRRYERTNMTFKDGFCFLSNRKRHSVFFSTCLCQNNQKQNGAFDAVAERSTNALRVAGSIP